MIATAINRTWQQLLHPKFRSVFFTSVLAALVTLVLLTAAVNHYWPERFVTGWDWLDSYGDSFSTAGFVAVVTFGSYFLFPGVVTMVMGLLTDQIAGAVEEEYYPNRLGDRKVPLGDVFVSAAKLTLIMLVLNLVFLIPYILLLFLTGGIGTLILFIVLNGLLIGREYFEMVAIRHMDRHEVTRMRKTNNSKVFVGGALVAGMFLVPVLNLVAPIVGAAVMTHIFHHLKAMEPSSKRRGI